MQPNARRAADPANDTILLPQNSLIVLCGPAGAGKSTFARSVLHCNGLPATAAVSSDACRLALCDELNERAAAQWSVLQQHTSRLFLAIVDLRLSLERPTLADGVNLDRELRMRLLGSAQKHGYHSALVVFDLSLDTCLAQNRQREPAGRIPERMIRGQRQALDEAQPHLPEEGWDRIVLLDDQRRAVPIDLDGESS